MIHRFLVTLNFSLFLVTGSLCLPEKGFTAESEQKQVPSCQTCGAPITGIYYKIPGLPELYCEKCNKTLPHCCFCGRPVSESPGKTRTVCPECRKELVQDPREADRLVNEVHSWISIHLALQLPAHLRFQFVDHLAPHVGVKLLGTMRELGAYIREGKEVRILLIKGMPRSKLIETAAHELAHVWQEGRVPRNQRLILKEGFAQWVASKVLEHFECEQALRVLNEREDLYGQGYRLLHDLEQREGRNAVIEYVKRSQ